MKKKTSTMVRLPMSLYERAAAIAKNYTVPPSAPAVMRAALAIGFDVLESSGDPAEPEVERARRLVG